MRRDWPSTVALVALVVLGTLVATVPAGASGATPAQQADPAAQTDDRTANATDRPFGGTAVQTLADAGDGALVAGGVELPANATVRAMAREVNGTLLKVDDGAVVWERTFPVENASTRVTTATVGPDGIVYFLLSTQPTDGETAFPPSEVELVAADGSGEIAWRHSLNTSERSSLVGGGNTLAATDGGVAVAYALPDDSGVRLETFDDGTRTSNETYGIDAVPRTVEPAGDGLLVAGVAGFDTPWVLRTDGDGDTAFNRTLPGSSRKSVVGAVPTDDGGALLAGTQRVFGGDVSQNAWVSRLDSDGVQRFSRVYGVGADGRVRHVFDHGDGLLLFEGQSLTTGDATARLRAVAGNGTELFAEETESLPRATAAVRAGDTVRVAGLEGLLTRNLSATDATVPVPAVERSAADAGLDADIGPTSNESVYRGQNLLFEGSETVDGTAELLRVPGEYDEFDPQVVRRVGLGDGPAVVESATLAAGEYVLTVDGDPVDLADGEVVGTANRSAAAFAVESQRFYRVETNRTFVDTTAGERNVSLTVDAARSDYAAHVAVEDSDGESATVEELRAAFGDADGFVGIEAFGRDPVARIQVGEDARLNATVGELDAGLHEVTVSSVDTRDGGAVATARVVVAGESARQLGLSVSDRTLTLPVGGEAETTVSLTNVTDGVSAMSMSVNRSGAPPFGLDADVDINASRARGSAMWSDRRASTSGTAFDGDTGNGTVRVGTVGVQAREIAFENVSAGNNTATLSIDWVVGEDGRPYVVPDNAMLSVEVVGTANATGGPESGTTGTGSSSESGSASGSGSGSSSASESTRQSSDG